MSMRMLHLISNFIVIKVKYRCECRPSNKMPMAGLFPSLFSALSIDTLPFPSPLSSLLPSLSFNAKDISKRLDKLENGIGGAQRSLRSNRYQHNSRVEVIGWSDRLRVQLCKFISSCVEYILETCSNMYILETCSKTFHEKQFVISQNTKVICTYPFPCTYSCKEKEVIPLEIISKIKHSIAFFHEWKLRFVFINTPRIEQICYIKDVSII